MVRYILGIFLVFFASTVVSSTCERMTQCDSCTTSGQFQQAALNAAPPIPAGQDFLQCRVYVVSLDNLEARVFTVDKGEEPGFTYEWAAISTLTASEEDAFDDFFLALAAFEASPQTIPIPPDVVESAYQLPGSTYLRGQVGEYINENHPGWNFVYGSAAGAASLVDALGFSFSRLLTITVTFSDGSTGLYRVEVLGIGNAEWRIIEESFEDSEGNVIFFDPSDYAGQSGPISGSAASFLVNRLVSGGWSVEGDWSDSSASCTWRCDPGSGGSEQARCYLSCSSE